MTKGMRKIVYLAWVSAMLVAISFWPAAAMPDSSDATPHSAKETDPARGDPSPNLSPPASMEEIQILSHGNRLNGLMYLPGGTGPHAIIIFLHGYPGDERNLDLAQAVRRAGYAALYFDYRGDFGSDGTFSFTHSLEDTATVLAWTRAPENVMKYHIDPTRIALVGHSFGGWLALLGVEHEPPGVCVAALAAWNVGWAAALFPKRPEKRTETLRDLRTETDISGGPIRANADDLLDEMTEHAAAWNYLLHVNALKGRPLLLVAATRDTPDEGVESHAQLAKSIGKAGGKLVRIVTFEDDHPFSSHRIELADTLVHWLRRDCAKAQAGAANPK